MLRNLLMYRLITVNLLGVAGLIWLYSMGHLTTIWKSDVTYLNVFMSGLFIAGTVSAFVRAAKITSVLNSLKRGLRLDVNENKFRAKTKHVAALSIFLISIGFVGTLIGLGMSVHDNPRFDDVSAMWNSIVSGLRVAIYTGLVGSTLGIWAELNKEIIYTAMECMFEDAKSNGSA